MTTDEKNKILDQVVIILNRTSLLQVLFEEDGDEHNAKKFRLRRNRLRVERDELLRELLQQWAGDAKQLTKKLRDNNKQIDKAIKEISKDIQKAQNVVKALGLVDDVVVTVAGIIP